MAVPRNKRPAPPSPNGVFVVASLVIEDVKAHEARNAVQEALAAAGLACELHIWDVPRFTAGHLSWSTEESGRIRLHGVSQ